MRTSYILYIYIISAYVIFILDTCQNYVKVRVTIFYAAATIVISIISSSSYSLLLLLLFVYVINIFPDRGHYYNKPSSQ